MPRKRYTIPKPKKHELKIIREQERILFDFDPGMRAMFHDDFDTYFEAIHNPELMEKHFQRRLRELENKILNKPPQPFFDTSASFVTTGQFDYKDDEEEFFDEDDDDEFEKAYNHPLVVAARTWEEHIETIMIRWYEARGAQTTDVDAFRAWRNAHILPVKIFVMIQTPGEKIFGDELEDELEDEFKQEYADMVITFIDRALESLKRLAARQNNIALPAKLLYSEGKNLRQAFCAFINTET